MIGQNKDFIQLRIGAESLQTGAQGLTLRLHYAASEFYSPEEPVLCLAYLHGQPSERGSSLVVLQAPVPDETEGRVVRAFREAARRLRGVRGHAGVCEELLDDGAWTRVPDWKTLTVLTVEGEGARFTQLTEFRYGPNAWEPYVRIAQPLATRSLNRGPLRVRIEPAPGVAKAFVVHAGSRLH